ncbi:MAG: hypothetical protein KGL91_10605 [Xanthomonadaceae bacterium]|nr:hypothetical protein [Xanthomonadaceae bacterium]
MRLPVLLPLLCLLAACSAPSPPEPEQRPEPKAATTSPITATANAYKGAASNAAARTEGAAKQQQKDLDAATQ